MQFLFVGFLVTLGALIAIAFAPGIIMVLLAGLKLLGFLVAVAFLLVLLFGTRWYRRL